MEIIRTNSFTVQFNELAVGEIFRDGSYIYMRIEETIDAEGYTYNVVCLSDGSLDNYQQNTSVESLREAHLAFQS